MPSTTIQFFKYDHLTEDLQEVAEPIGELANSFESMIPDCAEKSAAMRKLLEARDCFLRSIS